MRRTFAKALDELDDEQFAALYGSCDPLQPEQVAELLAGLEARWFIAGGRSARAGSAARSHDSPKRTIAGVRCEFISASCRRRRAASERA
jgi:hypothetical protein